MRVIFVFFRNLWQAEWSSACSLPCGVAVAQARSRRAAQRPWWTSATCHWRTCWRPPRQPRYARAPVTTHTRVYRARLKPPKCFPICGNCSPKRSAWTSWTAPCTAAHHARHSEGIWARSHLVRSGRSCLASYRCVHEFDRCLLFMFARARTGRPRRDSASSCLSPRRSRPRTCCAP